MAERKTYAVFVGSKWARTTRRIDAIRVASRNPGAEVRSMPHSLGKGSWDAPTFYSMSDREYTNHPQGIANVTL